MAPKTRRGARLVSAALAIMFALAAGTVVAQSSVTLPKASGQIPPGSGQPSVPANTPAFAGRSWQLVKFQGSDGTTLTPDDRAKYTIEFVTGGQLTARVDCNRGRGTWKSSGPNQVQFGPLALTRAKCPVGSLHDHIVKQWNSIRSYVMKDGHLFLSLMADGGIYEFEPIAKSKP